MLTAREIAALLGAGQFDLTSEANTQADMEQYLAARLPLDCSLSREHRLSPEDRPDFLVNGGVAVEVKVSGAQPLAILRQLKRYAAHDAVTSLILATGKAVALPPEIDGKPLYLVNLGRAWL